MYIFTYIRIQRDVLINLSKVKSMLTVPMRFDCCSSSMCLWACVRVCACVWLGGWGVSGGGGGGGEGCMAVIWHLKGQAFLIFRNTELKSSSDRNVVHCCNKLSEQVIAFNYYICI